MFEKIDDNIKKIQKDYKNSTDISFKHFYIQEKKIVFVFNQSLCSSEAINNFILKNLSLLIENKKRFPDDLLSYLENTFPSHNIKEINSFEDCYYFLGNGFTILFVDNNTKAIAIETRLPLSRSVSEPITEQTISGPKDAFNENYLTNIGLIRKRIRTNDLIVKESVIGKQTKTKISLIYMDNIVEDELVKQVEERIDKIDIDGILDSTYIRQIITNRNNIFPTIETTERPDLACMNLLEGRIVIIAENSPYALIIPTFFIDMFHASEDNYQNSKNVSFTRIIRYISFILAVLTPAFYIAITTFNHEAIPVDLFVSFAAQREGVPFPAIIEALGMTLIFEILRESDVRMPHSAGSAISILGAVVLGDAAVSAGIVSPIMVIVIAISAISSFMFTNIGMINSIRVWRIIFMLFATFFGIYGIFLCGTLLILELADMKSFGKPYLYPIAPFNLEFFTENIFKKNIKKVSNRMPILTNKNKKRSRL